VYLFGKAGFLSTQNNGTQGVRSKTALFLVRKTELRTLLRSKNRLFSTQGNGTQRSTQRKHENGQGGMITLGTHWMRPRPSLFSVSPK